MISRDIPDPQQPPTQSPRRARCAFWIDSSRLPARPSPRVWPCGASPAFAGGFYELQFVPAGPIFAVEDDNGINFQVQLDVVPCAPFAVTWEVEIEHITTDATDIGLPMPDPVVLSDTQPFANINIPINNDSFIEGQESFFFKLTPSSMVDIDCIAPPIPPTEAFYKVEVILDDDEDFGDDHLVVKNAGASEGAGSLQFEVERVNADLSFAASATFALVEQSATEGVDYLYPLNNVINFPMGGPTTQIVTVDLVDDDIVEPPETFSFRLTGSTTTAIGDGLAQGTIFDNDAVPIVFIQDFATPEGDETRIEPVLARVTHVEPPRTDPVTVSYTVEAGTATPGEDFVLASGTLTFAPGDPAETIPLQILGDTLPEDDETFVIRLSGASGADIVDDEATITLLNDDISDGPIVSVNDVEVVEGDEGGTDVQLTVHLDAPQAENFSVAFATEDGSAVAGVDYEAAEGVLEFPAGETAATLTLTVLGDLVDEPDEMFRVRLDDVDGQIANLGKTQASRIGDEPAPVGRAQAADKLVGDTEAVITIVDDDGATGADVEVGVENTAVTEGDEGARPARFTVRLSEPAPFTVGVLFETFDGTATAADDDYVPRTGQVVFEPGTVERVVAVPVVGDTRVEDDETFGLRLTDADGAVIVRDEATALIRNDDDDDGGGDDDGPGGGDRSVVRVLPTQPTTEGAGPAVIRLERVGSLVGPVRAVVAIGGGSATAGQDYTGGVRVVQWAPGQSLVELAIPILDDNRQEDSEAFFVRLVEAQNADVGSPSEARQLIVDDDTPMHLVALSDQEQTVRLGSELVLEARVERDDGEPVAGAQVRWASVRKALIAGDETTISGEDGVVRQRVRFAATPGVAGVGARLVGSDATLEFRFRVQGNLDSTIGDNDGDDGDVADAFDEGCADEDEGDEFEEACDYLFGIDNDAERRQALDGLSPRQALPHQRQALRAPRNQVRNVSARMTALRGGMARSAFDQLALSIQGQGLGLSPLQSAIAGHDPAVDAQAHIADRVDLALRRAAGLLSEEDARKRLGLPPEATRGGAASGDGPGEDDPFDYGSESPWGMFFNGRISFGDAPSLGARPDFEFQTEGVTLGVDRRVGSKWVLGAALGYTQSDTDVGSNLGSLDLTGLSLTFYSTYYTKSWYVDGVFSYGQNEFDVERFIDLPVPFRGVTRLTAVGSPDAVQTAANVGFGYDFRLGDALTLSGFVRANWTRAEIDSYTETGAGLFNLQYEDQTLDSLLGEVGFELTRPVSFDWGVLQPLLRVAVLHEFDDDLDVVRARFARGRAPRTFRIEGSATDRDFFNVAVGATATLRRGWATYFQYDTDLERDDLDLYTFSGGFRFQF